jgi:hypothetical protein
MSGHQTRSLWTTVPAVLGLLIMLVTGPLVVSTGASPEYSVEVTDELTDQQRRGALSPPARSVVDRALERSTVRLAPSSFEGTTTAPSYPDSFPDEPRPEDDFPETTFVVVDGERYVTVTAEINRTAATDDGPRHWIDLTATDRTDAVVRQWGALPSEARVVIERARDTPGSLAVHSSPPPALDGGYDPDEFRLFGEADEFVVVQGDREYVVRVERTGDFLDFDGVFTVPFVAGALLVVPALTRATGRRDPRVAVAVAAGVAFVVTAVLFVHVVARPPPLTDPLKPYQASEQAPLVVLSGLAAAVVVVASAAWFSRSADDDS